MSAEGLPRTLLVMYMTTGPNGPVAASGIVSLPSTPAPPGGWPVVASDHGTMGIGTNCATSRTGWSAVGLQSGDMLAELLNRGIAVVQTDYIGMGVPGTRHPYLNGKFAAYATLDLVRAAHAVDSGVGTTMLVTGHSQGGHAALWTASYQPEYASELDLKGVVAMAPGTGFQFMPGLVAQRDATAAPYIGIFLMLVDGAAAADPAVKPEQILTPDALAVADRAWSDCLGTVVGGTMPDPADVLKPDADLGPINAALQANATEQVNLRTPVFLPQGDQDPLSPLNSSLTRSLCAKGASVEFKPYAGASHGDVTTAAKDDALAWIKARLDGAPVTGACAPSP
ncbi:alpha/beta fold hydrolase [Yinghuangia seranimata]|uniref:alpha/beta fold hydrolase n=1 Tax=Yinghuangia seranimata TaxID=408067 RepID=UPI00248B1A12|nr:alpha/beta fold hydrolase [Yinghuangia seranimata]MDI2132241.1 alpha/beta fold hydrolase [Yinghuangia seranimata]